VLQTSITIVENSDTVPELGLLKRRGKKQEEKLARPRRPFPKPAQPRDRDIEDDNGPWDSEDGRELVGRQCRLSGDRPS